MRRVFADTVYWLATANPNDQWAVPAREAKEKLGDVFIVTTDEVLSEFATSMGKSAELRRTAAQIIRTILSNPNVKVVPQTRDGFLKGLERYESRLDKTYSLADCISMNVMKSENIHDVLTKDHHFEQEGFKVLIQKNARRT